jgi:site-specific recombinase XerD
MVVRSTGLPDIPLTKFANELPRSLSGESVRAYLREVIALANWALMDQVALANQWTLHGPPASVRNLIREYLCVGARCKITLRPDVLGLTVAHVEKAGDTRVNVRTLLAALKRFYELLISQSLYAHHNPLIHQDAEQLAAEVQSLYRQAFRSSEGRYPMPRQSGVDRLPPNLRLSANYFRCIRDKWIPETIDDPDFPHLVYAAGKQYGWGLRELCVVRTLFESGARISEVFSLTAADWSHSHFNNIFSAPNKGSHGRRTKLLLVAPPTAKLYRKYFNDATTGRHARDPQKLTLGQLESLRSDPPRLASIPLFLTARGKAMTAQLFRDYYWKPALQAAGIDADPHLARHWFVTNAMRNIEASCQNEVELLRRKAELIQYMAWRSGEQTLATYEHLHRRASFFGHLQDIHKAMKRRARDSNRKGSVTVRSSVEERKTMVGGRELDFLLGEDHEISKSA